MSLNKRDSDVGGMLSVPRSAAKTPIINIYNTAADGKDGKDGKDKDGGGGGGGDGTTDVTGGGGGGGDGGLGGGGGPGVYTGGDLPKITGKDDFGTAIDKYTTGVGAFASQTDTVGGKVDTKAASELAGLAKGKGAGEGDKQKANESAIANILSLGLPNVVNTGGGDKNKGGDDKNKDKGKDDKGKDDKGKDDKGKDDNKKSNTSSILSGLVTTPTGAVKSGGGGGAPDKKDNKGKKK